MRQDRPSIGYPSGRDASCVSTGNRFSHESALNGRLAIIFRLIEQRSERTIGDGPNGFERRKPDGLVGVTSLLGSSAAVPRSKSRAARGNAETNVSEVIGYSR